MFIKKSFVDEIASSMERYMIDGAINKHAEKEASLVKAAEYLNAVAEIFDDAGLPEQSEVVTTVLESLAAKNKKTKKKNKKPSNKQMTSDQMVNNLKTKGWMFDENGAHDKNHADDNFCPSCDSSQAFDGTIEDKKFWAFKHDDGDCAVMYGTSAEAQQRLISKNNNASGWELTGPFSSINEIDKRSQNMENQLQDMSMADDGDENEIMSMLKDFKDNTKGMEFEDELDFNGFNDRLNNSEFSPEAYENFEDSPEKW